MGALFLILLALDFRFSTMMVGEGSRYLYVAVLFKNTQGFKTTQALVENDYTCTYTMVFPIVKYRCGSWTTKKAEHQRIDAFDLFAVQGTLKSLLQHHSFKALILWCSAFFVVQLSHPYMTTGKDPNAGKDRRQEEKETTNRG